MYGKPSLFRFNQYFHIPQNSGWVRTTLRGKAQYNVNGKLGAIVNGGFLIWIYSVNDVSII